MFQDPEDIMPEVDDPFCNPDKPVKITFEEITSAAYKIRSGIVNTPCIVSKSVVILLCVLFIFRFIEISFI